MWEDNKIFTANSYVWIIDDKPIVYFAISQQYVVQEFRFIYSPVQKLLREMVVQIILSWL
jgi:hypothetical protein